MSAVGSTSPVMREAPLVRVEGLSKRYPVVGASGDRLSALGRLLLGRAPLREVEVLSGIDLTIHRGESLGIVGENGAGKSTLLKLITGTLTPSTGRVVGEARIGALLELGAGFHPEYSGRENVRMAAAIHGLAGEALAAKLPEIEAFAEIGRYFDEPVKHYSSGMVVRLGFAVIAATRPDLLITDEVLAVGDERFQKKCIRWIDQYLAEGGTLLLVSHSTYHVQKLCRHAIWLKDGRIEAQGDAFDVTQRYQAWLEQREAVDLAATAAGGDFRIDAMEVAMHGMESPQGGTIRIALRASSRHGERPHLLVGLSRIDGTAIFGTGTEIDGVAAWPIGAEGQVGAQLVLEDVRLQPGDYRLRAHAMDPEALRVFDTVERTFSVGGASREFGLLRLPHRWEAP
ncbi:ABC transporter ATP-binding protein [Silanimonas sp.]|uniref:ABC transporter ATP-binding protein n=1 Tax=Silanimonas sp. TaxID=1929290 RepID=UPI00262DE797|nr:ABC transporter ATP-binding protein [Silanimonas sp.]